MTIQTIDDDVVFQPSDMLVADWPARVGTVEVDEGEFVLQGAPVLSLTEPTFTITLSVSAERPGQARGRPGGRVSSSRPATRPARRASANSTTRRPSAMQGEEPYEGTVEVEGDLAAVDGASVDDRRHARRAARRAGRAGRRGAPTAGGDEVRVDQRRRDHHPGAGHDRSGRRRVGGDRRAAWWATNWWSSTSTPQPSHGAG